MASDTLVRTFYEGHLIFNGRKPLPDLSGSGYLSGSFPSGITSVEGAPVSATVRVLYRPGPGSPGDGVIVAQVQSAQDGTWLVDGLNHNLKYDVVGRKDGYNDVIMSNVSPALVEGLEFSGSLTTLDDQVQILLGAGPYQVELVDGTPPLGVSFSVQGDFVVATGTPENSGLFTFTLRVIDSNGLSGTFVSALEVADFDEHWNDVVALLHFDGDYTDEAGAAWSIYQSGTGFSEITTSSALFGSGGLSINSPAGNNISAPYTVNVIAPSDIFTVECFIRVGIDITTRIQYIFGSFFNSGDSDQTLQLSNGKLKYYQGKNVPGSVGVLQAVGSSTVPVGTWVHIAMVFDGATLTAYMNGTKELEVSTTLGWDTTSQPFFVGDLYIGSYTSSYRPRSEIEMDEVRITKGIARYTTNFTPPTEPFPRGANG